MVGRCSSRSSHCWTVHCMHPCLCLSLSFHLLLQLPLQLGRWTMASDDDDTVVCRGRRGCTVGLDTPMFRRFVVVSCRPGQPPPLPPGLFTQVRVSPRRRMPNKTMEDCKVTWPFFTASPRSSFSLLLSPPLVSRYQCSLCSPPPPYPLSSAPTLMCPPPTFPCRPHYVYSSLKPLSASRETPRATCYMYSDAFTSHPRMCRRTGVT